MKLNKNIIRKINMSEDDDDGYVEATMKERIEMVWDITVALWSVSTGGKINAESRIQRDVAVLKRRKR